RGRRRRRDLAGAARAVRPGRGVAAAAAARPRPRRRAVSRRETRRYEDRKGREGEEGVRPMKLRVLGSLRSFAFLRAGRCRATEIARGIARAYERLLPGQRASEMARDAAARGVTREDVAPIGGPRAYISRARGERRDGDRDGSHPGAPRDRRR